MVAQVVGDIVQRFLWSSSIIDVAFLSAEDTNSINEVNYTPMVFLLKQAIAAQGKHLHHPYTILHFFANQSCGPLLCFDKAKVNVLTVIEEAILPGNYKHQEINGTGMEIQGIGAGTTPEELYVETSDALVVQDNALILQDGLGYDWSYIAQDETTEFALMAYTSNSSRSDTERMLAYQLGLESVEAQLVVHQKNEVVYEEKIAVFRINT
ncbi:hypothetical protein Tco_1439706 [Tanacetum coccineum]